MATDQPSHKSAPPQGSATRGTSFPVYDLSNCIEVPRAIHVKGGGQATADQLAAHLGYKGTANGAYISRVAAARAYGLINKAGLFFAPTPLAHQILSPIYPQDAKRAMVDAFLTVDLFRRVYEDFQGKHLPPEEGMKNALRHQYGVAPTRLADAYRVLMDSADAAGFFTTKAGARTHLIMPQLQVPSGPPIGFPAPGAAREAVAVLNEDDEGGGASNIPDQARSSSGAGAQQVSTLSSAQEAYLNLLVRMLEKKVAEGEPDEKLMERIERLLGLEGASK